MKRILSILLLLSLLLTGCSDFSDTYSDETYNDYNDEENTQADNTVDNSESEQTNEINELYVLDNELIKSIKDKILTIEFFDSYDRKDMTIDFRSQEEYIYHILVEVPGAKIIYRYSQKADEIYQEAIEENGEIGLLYTSYDTDFLMNYAKLGIDPPTFIDMDEYNDILNNDRFSEY